MDFNYLEEVSSGSFDWTVRVRVLRKWRGVSSSNGKEFKGFNILFVDSKSCRLPGFVPALVSQKYEAKIIVGNVHVLSNFNVKDYKPDENFRAVCCEKQIYFTNFTEVEVVADDDVMIPRDIFDFSDLGDLIDIAGDNTYLTDVIGVIYKDSPIRRFVNKLGVPQSQIKVDITDGRCSHCVTFWDALAEEFNHALTTVSEFPAILIVASAKITSWQKQVDIANVTATTFYLNYNHHSVFNLRQMLGTPLFSKYDFSSQIPQTFEQHDIASIKTLGVEYLNVEVICELKLILVVEMEWFKAECSACYREIEIVDGEYRCIICNRELPFADKKFHIMAEAIDGKDSIEISINDRTIRTLLGITVNELVEEGCTNEKVPPILRTLESKWYNAKVRIGSHNIERPGSFYYVTDMYVLSGGSTSIGSQRSMNVQEVSSSSIHLDGLEDLNFYTPDVTKKNKNKTVLMS